MKEKYTVHPFKHGGRQSTRIQSPRVKPFKANIAVATYTRPKRRSNREAHERQASQCARRANQKRTHGVRMITVMFNDVDSTIGVQPYSGQHEKYLVTCELGRHGIYITISQRSCAYSGLSADVMNKQKRRLDMTNGGRWKMATSEDLLSWRWQTEKRTPIAHKSSLRRPSIAAELLCHLSRRFLFVSHVQSPRRSRMARGQERKLHRQSKGFYQNTTCLNQRKRLPLER